MTRHSKYSQVCDLLTDGSYVLVLLSFVMVFHCLGVKIAHEREKAVPAHGRYCSSSSKYQ